MLMLMAVRHAKSVICRADTHDYRLHDVRGKELRDLTVGVIGTGRIGSAVVDRLRGFGCRVLTYDSRPQSFTEHVPVDELLQQSDIVTLHTPLNADTHHLLDRRRIEQMKHGAVIVNTGRGALLDTEALVSALENGRLGGAALDVLEGEEGIFYADFRDEPVGNELLLQLQAMPNVLISPHTAYYTDHAVTDMVENTLINCMNFERRRAGVPRLKIGTFSEEALKKPHLRQVRARGRQEPRHGQVRTVLDRDHERTGRGSCVTAPARLGERQLPPGCAVTGQGRARVARPGRGAVRDGQPRPGVPRAARQARRGRRDPGSVGAVRHSLRRLRCPELRGVHGQVPGLCGR